MSYEKPNVVSVAVASKAVQGTKDGMQLDNPLATPAAYEADE
jgi:hypothetical protein